jgi:hypothetical protein
MMAGLKAKVNLKDLEKFKANIERLNGKKRQQWTEAALKELAARLLARVIHLTPVGKPPRPVKSERSAKFKVKDANGKAKIRSFMTAGEARYQQYWKGYKGGTLRRGWTGGKKVDAKTFANSLAVTKSGDMYTIEIINPIEYAVYVEHGHRQTPGRYVPAIGKRLKNSFVEGKHMLKISEVELQRDAPRILMNKLNKFMRDNFK